MAANDTGSFFRLTTFGESHGRALGGVIDGCPPGLFIDTDYINNQLLRRSTGRLPWDSERNESDTVEFLSGISPEGYTLGTPIAFYILNSDARGGDYDIYRNIFRPSHADFTWSHKYQIRDYRGGGRASARETVARVAGGAIASMLLKEYGVGIRTYTSQIGPYRYVEKSIIPDFREVEKSIIACPDSELSDRMINYLERMKREKDSTGGVVACIVTGIDAGLGEPVFDKLQAELAKSMMSIPAAKGFEYGMGFKAASMRGSEHNDVFVSGLSGSHKFKTVSNLSGGILGGISNSEDIYFKVAFKPVPSIGKMQGVLDINGEIKEMELKGRFDICVIPRVLPVVEAMTALTLADSLLKQKIYSGLK